MQTLFFQVVHEAIGLSAFSFTAFMQMIVRGIIVYFFGLSMARFNKKLMGIRTPFNFVLFIMLGSIFANAIIYANSFFPILGTVLLLSLLNGLVTALAFYFPAVELFVKGAPIELVQNGKIQWSAMKKNFITKQELLNELYIQLHTRSFKQVASAILTTDGTIDFIKQAK